MGKQTFENLQVYQSAEKLANEIWSIVKTWDYFSQDTVGKRLVSAVDRIGARIAEGDGRDNLAENQRFAKLARGSFYETIHWLRLAYNRELLSSEQIEQIRPLINELLSQIKDYLDSLINH